MNESTESKLIPSSTHSPSPSSTTSITYPHTLLSPRTLCSTLYVYTSYNSIIGRKYWIKQFCILHDQCIFICNKQPDSIELGIQKPSTVIYLQYCILSLNQNPPTVLTQHNTTFTIQRYNQNHELISEFWLACTNDADYIDWTNAIQISINLPNLLTGQPDTIYTGKQSITSNSTNNSTLNSPAINSAKHIIHQRIDSISSLIWPSYSPNTTNSNNPNTNTNDVVTSIDESTINDDKTQLLADAMSASIDDCVQINVDTILTSDDSSPIQIDIAINGTILHTTSTTSSIDDIVSEPPSTLLLSLQSQLEQAQLQQQQLIDKLVKLKSQRKLLSREIKSLQTKLHELQQSQHNIQHELDHTKYNVEQYNKLSKNLLIRMTTLQQRIHNCTFDVLYNNSIRSQSQLPQSINELQLYDQSNKQLYDIMDELKSLSIRPATTLQSHNTTIEPLNPFDDDSTLQPTNPFDHTFTHNTNPFAEPSPSSDITDHLVHPHQLSPIDQLIDLYQLLYRSIIQLHLTNNTMSINIYQLNAERLAEFKAKQAADQLRRKSAANNLKYFGNKF